MRHPAPLSALLICFLLLPAASFAATYVYTSPDYPASAIQSTGTPAYTTAMHLSGWFTLANPLPANFSGDITPLVQSYSFDDGLHTYTQANSHLFLFTAATNTSGQINNNFAFSITSPGSPYSVGEFIDVLDIQSGLSVIESQTPCGGISSGATYCTFTNSGSSVSSVSMVGGQYNYGSFTLLTTAAAPALSPFALVLFAALTIAAPALPRFGLALIAAASALIGAGRRRKTAIIARRR